jgi:hypothetical protein
MEVRATLKTSMWLFVGMSLAFLLAEVTALLVFSLIAMITSIWLALNLYWLGICFFYYLSIRNDPPNIDEENQLWN